MTEDSTVQKSPLLKNVSKNLIFSGVTGLLILIVLFQSFQLQQLKGYAQGFLQVQNAQTASAAAAPAATPTPARPTNSGLPSQVGGC